MRVLITGARGFLGSSAAAFARERGHDVVGIAHERSGAEGASGVRIVAGDVNELDVTAIVEEHRPDVVLHFAGTASVGASVTAPLHDLKQSLMSWASLLEGVRRSSCRPVVVYPSSAAVYGNPRRLPVSEDAPTQPVSPYGYHKLAGELIGREYAGCFGLRVVVARLFSVFGPRQHRLLVWELYRQLAGAAESVVVEGTGAESRDFLHVDDVLTALFSLSACAHDEGAPLTVNIGSGSETTVRALAESLRSGTSSTKEIIYRGLARPGDPLRWCAEVARLRALVPGWAPTRIDEALAACVGSWRANASADGFSPAR